MKKIAVVFALFIFTMAIFVPFTLNIQAVNAQSNYSIQKVSHNIQVLYSGQVVISETIQLSGQMPSTFELGLPFKYGSYLLKGMAYDNNYKILPMTVGIQLQNQNGFYGASVALPSGTPNTFTVVFILSNGVLARTSDGYNIDFPAYLCFTQSVSDYSASLTVPLGATVTSIDKTDGSIKNAGTYSRSNLPAFTYSPASAALVSPYGYIQSVNLPSLERKISVNPAGEITGTDIYKIVNNSTDPVISFLFNVPIGSSNIIARDEFGAALLTSVYQNTSQAFVQNVTLSVGMSAGDSHFIYLDYSLPKITSQSSRFVLNLNLFSYFNYYIDSVTVVVSPPEGATITEPQLSQIGFSTGLKRDVFQESISISNVGISFVDSIIPSENNEQVTFDYNPLWIAFRPTSWVFAIAAAGIIVLAIWTRPKGKKSAQAKIAVVKVAPGVALSPEHIKDYIDAYEEKNKLSQEISALDVRAQHGRIPRRRYKVQRRTLELRVETLSHNIAHLKEILRSAGGSYADTVRQVENTEIELSEVQLSLKNIEVRHEAGEISMEVYRKQLADLERRREKAEATLGGLMLRLRGEVR